MKICPTCNRVYEDETLSFCLDDGSVLSTPYDPHKTERISAPRRTEAPPTEVLYSGSRVNELTPPLPETIASPQPRAYQENQPFQPQEKRSNRTGLVLTIGVILGVILAIAATAVWMRSGNDSAVDNRTESKNSNEPKLPVLTELPGNEWRECEGPATGPETCGQWSRKSKGQWFGEWGGVQANLEVTIEGKNVTVKRREITSTLEATYRGTLNAENTQITGTVDWCCDQFGNRSGLWRADISNTTATKGESGWGPMQQASINQGDGQMLTYYGGSTPDQCQADCDKNPKCKAFTFIKAGAYSPTDPPMCYLMSEAQKLTPSSCCISAVKR